MLIFNNLVVQIFYNLCCSDYLKHHCSTSKYYCLDGKSSAGGHWFPSEKAWQMLFSLFFQVMLNQTSVNEFLLLPVTDIQVLQPVLFVVFVATYIVSLAGNGAILMVASLIQDCILLCIFSWETCHVWISATPQWLCQRCWETSCLPTKQFLS